MFNMKLLTLASLLVSTTLTSPISTTSDITPASLTPPTAHLARPTFPFTIIGQYPPPFPFPPGYLAPRSAAPTPTAGSTSITDPDVTVQISMHHLPDCLASDAGVSLTLEAGPCYPLPVSFLSYTARMMPVAAGALAVGDECKMYVYSARDCSGFESSSGVLTGKAGKCTGTGLRVVDGLAGVGAVGARVVCA